MKFRNRGKVSGDRDGQRRCCGIHSVGDAALAIALAAPLWGGAARAQALQVTPVNLELAAGQMASTIQVTNASPNKILLQVRPFAWNQAGLTDSLTPTDDIAVSPPITSLGPGETQTVRVVCRRASQDTELSWRLLIDEIPSTSQGAVQFAIRLSIPVFQEPAGRRPPPLAWRIALDEEGATLRVRNNGGERTRLITPELSVPGVHGLRVVADANPYILKQSERAWRIDGGTGLRPGMSVRLTGLSDSGRLDVVVPVTAP